MHRIQSSFGFDCLFDRSRFLEMDVGKIAIAIDEDGSTAIYSFGKEPSQNTIETRGV